MFRFLSSRARYCGANVYGRAIPLSSYFSRQQSQKTRRKSEGVLCIMVLLWILYSFRFDFDSSHFNININNITKIKEKKKINTEKEETKHRTK